MNFGYARITTRDQAVTLQVDALAAAGCAKIHTEVVSGAAVERPVLARLLEEVRPGDVVVIWKLDRLGGSLKHLIDIVNRLSQQDVGLRSLNDPIDTTTPHGRSVFSLFASLADFERDIIRERTQVGLSAARARGRKGGRPKGLSPKAEQTTLAAETLYREGRLTAQQIAEHLHISKSTLYAYLRHRGVAIGVRDNPVGS
jgi:DNA invertase Pin-like site-specific DNA recombinase